MFYQPAIIQNKLESNPGEEGCIKSTEQLIPCCKRGDRKAFNTEKKKNNPKKNKTFINKNN